MSGRDTNTPTQVAQSSLWRKGLRWLPLAVLVAAIAAAYATGLHEQLSLEQIQQNRQILVDYVAAYPVLAIGAFMLAYTISTALSLPFGALLSLLGGFLFGRWLGTLYIVTGATIGAGLVFGIAKTALGETLREKAGPWYHKVAGNMQDNAFGYLMFLRLVPVFPFFVVNVLPAFFNVSWGVYLLTTFIGIIPGAFVFANFGEALGDISSTGDLISTEIIIALALLGLFALMPTLIKQWRVRKGKSDVAAIMLAVGALSLPSAAMAQQKAAYQTFIKNYKTLLQAHVAPVKAEGITYNGVNYNAWARDPAHNKALKALKKVDPAQFNSKREKLAFWINTYNFLTIDLITDKGERESIKNLGGLFTSPWEKYEWTIHGKDYSLDEIEHEIIRPMGEPRIHFAINCAAKSCPDLRRQAYRAAKLDAQLDAQVDVTLDNRDKGLRESNDNVIYVTKVMDWFREDFQDGNLKSWLDQYRPGLITKKTTIKFMEYDWSLNKQPTDKST
jgi:uncharacterized membrane protein YdjX (TVP38/TMEM64 family)